MAAAAERKRMRREIIVTYKGVTKALKAWAKEYGIRPEVLYGRYVNHQWDFEKALITPARQPKRYEYRGKMYTVGGLADLHGDISHAGMDFRLRRGWSTEKAVNTPNLKPTFKNPEMQKKNMKKPKGCTDPDCDKCPYPECVW